MLDKKNGSEWFSGTISLGEWATVFQAEVHAISSLVHGLITRGLHGSNVKIFTDSQAALQALRGDLVTTTTMRSCRLAVQNLINANNTVSFLWVPGHAGVPGNERADQLARAGSASPPTGVEPCLPVSGCIVKSAIKAGLILDLKSSWRDTDKGAYTKGLLREPSPKVTKSLLSLRRDNIRIITQTVCSQNNLKGHLYRIGRSPEPWCRFCEVEVETPIHLVESCSLLTPLRIEIFEDYTPSLRDIINNRKLSLLSNFFKRLDILF